MQGIFEALRDEALSQRTRTRTRLGLYRWLVFNVLVPNDDHRLKSISFNAGPHGMGLAPPYDLLSTGTYHTRAFADHRAIWSAALLMIALPGAGSFGDLTRATLLAAAAGLGLT